MAHTEYLQLRLGQWQASNDMDALMRAADHIDLLADAERSVWAVDGDRAAELVAQIQAAIAQNEGEIFNFRANVPSISRDNLIAVVKTVLGRP